MEFWGVEVKAGETLKVSPGEGNLIHLSQASIGDSKKSKSENIPVFVKVDEQKLVIGTLSADKFPQIQYDVVFDKEFELSHNWKNGSVFFCGYKTPNHADNGGYSGDEFESDSEDEDLALENGKPTPALAGLSNPTPAAKSVKIEDAKSVKIEDAKSVKIEDAKSDSDDDSSDEDDSDDDSDDADDSDDEDDFSEEEEEKAPTPKKDDKKRPTEAAVKTPVSAKKVKLATPQPQKTDEKKPATAAHTATPHPGKQVGKTPKNGNSKTPASTGKSHSNAKRAAK